MKQIDDFAVALLILGVDIGGLDEALEELWEKIPEREGGPEVSKEDFMDLGWRLWTDAKAEIQRLTGDLPPVSEDDLNLSEPEPEPNDSNKVKIMNTGQQMSWNSYMYDKFVFPKLGPEYTSQPFDLVFSDGNKLFVSDPEHMVMTPDNMKYQPGGKYSGNNPNIPTMEVYARRDTHPEWVVAMFRHPVDNTPVDPPADPVDPVDDRVINIQYGDNPELGIHGHDGRDRRWWTDIHGRGPGEAHQWTQKYELPDWVTEKSYRLEVEASDGQKFSFGNSRAKSDMLSYSGPKYRAGFDTGDGPKIGMKYGTKTTWIKVRVI